MEMPSLNEKFVFRKENSSLNVDLFDARKFNITHEASTLMDGLVNNNLIDNFGNVVADVWSAFYKKHPVVKDNEELTEQQQIQKGIVERVMSDEVYDKYSEITSYDETLSTVGTVNLGNKIVEWIFENVDEDIQEKMQSNNQSEKEKEEIEQAIKQLVQNLNPSNDGDDDGNELTQKQKDLQKKLNKSFGKKMKESKEETEEIQESMSNFFGKGKQAGNGDINPDKVPLADKLDLAKHLQRMPKLKKIMEWAGRFSRIALKKQKSKKIESIVRGGITMGNDIEQLLPQELLNYKNPKTRLDFLRRFAEGETLQYELVGDETAGQGAIILCLDESSSMKKMENQSKAILLAFLAIARKQKRSLIFVPFASSVGKVRKFPKGKIEVKETIQIAQSFLNGGTDFENPLSEAEKHIKKDYKNADIIFITDGEKSISSDFEERFLKLKKDKDFKMLTMIISNGKIADEQHLNKLGRHLLPFTDKLLGVSAEDFANGTNLDGMFEI